MDEELRAYLEQRFSAIDQRFSAIDQRFDQTHQEIQALREETTRRFAQVDRQFEQVEGKLEKVHTDARGAYVLLENLQHKVEIVAEGVSGVSERLDTLANQQASTNVRIDSLELRVLRLEKARR